MGSPLSSWATPSASPFALTFGWFTEGFDTKDLREARALRAELS